MKKARTRVGSILLTLALVLTLLPVSTMAKETPVSSAEELSNTIANATDGDIITLTQDITITSPITVDKAVTITSEPNVTVTANTGDYSFKLSNGAVLDGLTVTLGVVTKTINMVNMAGPSTVKNCKFMGSYSLGDSEVTRAIEGSSGELTITGNTFTNLRQPAYINACTGTISGNYADETRGWVICGESNMEMTGNTFGENAVDISIIASNGTNNYADQITTLSKSNNGAYVQNQLSGAEAEAGSLVVGKSDGYTLEKAVAAAQDGDTVKLLDNVTMTDGIELNKGADEELTLDLNGHTYTVEEGKSVNNRGFKIVSGTLNVIDSSSAQTGTMVAANNASNTGAYGVFRVEKDGVLNVTGVTLQNSRPWGLNVKVLGGIATLTDVDIISSYGGGIEVTEADLGEQSQPGLATMNNCTVTQTGYSDHCSSAVSVSGGSKLIVNGGTYTSEGTGIYVFSSGGFIEVLDGSFSGKLQVVRAEIDTNTYPEYEGGVELKGGNYTGGFTITSPATLSISGGTFSSDPSAYVAANYECVGPDVNGKYTVQKMADKLVVEGSVDQKGNVFGSLEGSFGTNTEIVDNTENTVAGGTPEESETNVSNNEVTVDLTTSDENTSATTTTLEVTQETAKSLSNANQLTVKTDAAEVSFDSDALSTIAAGADNAVTITVEKTNDSEDIENILASYEVSVQADGKDLLPNSSTDNGEVTITVPLDDLGNGISTENLTAWYVQNGVFVKELGGEVKGSSFVFSIGHLSEIYITDGTITSSVVASCMGSDSKIHYYDNLAEAVQNAVSGTTVKLENDTEFTSTIDIQDKTITLDLNGKTATFNGGASTYAIALGKDAHLIIDDSQIGGTLVSKNYRVIKVGNGSISTSASGPASLTLNGGTVSSEKVTYTEGDKETDHGAIAVYANSSATHGEDDAVACTVTVNSATVNGGIYVFGQGAELTVNNGAKITSAGYAISGNGSKTASQNNGDTKVTINGGTITQTGGTADQVNTAIYQPQDGELIITGGSISSDNTAVEVRSGSLTVTGGNISGGSTNPAVVSNGNGPTTSNTGIAIAQHTTKQAIDVNITGGTISGSAAVYESNPQSNDSTSAVNVNVQGAALNGDLMSSGFGAVAVENTKIDGDVSKTGTGAMAIVNSKITGTVSESGVTLLNCTDAQGQPITNQVPGNKVAMVGTNTYDSLSDAVTAVSNGTATGTIYLLKDTTENVTIPVGATITIDGGADKHTIKGTITCTANGTDTQTTTLTLQNLTMDGDTDGDGENEASWAVGSANQSATSVNGLDLTMENCTVKNYLNKGMYLTNAVALSIDSCEFTNNATTSMNTPNNRGDYTIDLNLVAVQDADISITNTTFSGECGKKAVVKVVQRGVNDGTGAADITGEMASIKNFVLSGCTFSDTTAAADVNLGTAKKDLDATGDNLTGNFPATISNNKTPVVVRMPYLNTTDTDSDNTSTSTPSLTVPQGQTATKTADGSLEIQQPTPEDPVIPSDPGSSDKDDDDDDDGYSITIPASSSVRGGSISVNPRRADKGDTVTITVTPDDGYVLKDLTVTVRSGGEVDLTRKNSSQYTFKMPAGAVVIEVSFVESDSAAEVEMSFTDVPADYWAVSEIQWAFENGYMNGTSATTFNPSGTVSRQQVWMILARMAGANPADMAAAKAWAVEAGISDGTNPGGAVSRQQLVALLYRFAAQNGYDTNAKADLSGYPDVASLASYAADAMAWSVANGIIGGTTQGTLNPAGTANRAQFAVILWRFYQTTAV